MKIIMIIALIVCSVTLYGQNPTSITIVLPTPFGDKVPKEFTLPLRDTTVVIYQETDKSVSTYSYSIANKNDTIYVKCIFIVDGKKSKCDFKVPLQTHAGKILPQQKRKESVVQ